MVDERSPSEPWRNPELGYRDTSRFLMNYQWGREQKWIQVRVSTVDIPALSENPNCDICLKTKITRASCRRRIGGAVPRAENFGDLVTADHKILSEGSESRNNHRNAVVVQDLATQWLQSYPYKTKTSKETHKEPNEVPGADEETKSHDTDNSLEFGKSCEELSWNHCTSTPHTSETNGIAERAVL